MATHSSVLAWRIPGTGEPGGLPSMGSHRAAMTQNNFLISTSEFQLHSISITDFGERIIYFNKLV